MSRRRRVAPGKSSLWKKGSCRRVRSRAPVRLSLALPGILLVLFASLIVKQTCHALIVEVETPAAAAAHAGGEAPVEAPAVPPPEGAGETPPAEESRSGALPAPELAERLDPAPGTVPRQPRGESPPAAELQTAPRERGLSRRGGLEASLEARPFGAAYAPFNARGPPV